MVDLFRANYLLWVANILHVIALREQLQRPRRLGVVLAACVVMVLGFEYWHQVAENSVMRF